MTEHRDRYPPPLGRSPGAGVGWASRSCWRLYWGLFLAPAEAYMGDVQRIMYVHVPTAWNGMLVVIFAFVCALAFLLRGKLKVGLAPRSGAGGGRGALGPALLQGSIWAKPTWGVWWDWDPRLTTTAVLLFAFAGILALRQFVDDPVKRAVWSAVATIIASVDVPIVYFSVKVVELAAPAAVHAARPCLAAFHWPLRINAFGVLFLMIGFIMLRTRIAALRLRGRAGAAACRAALGARPRAGGCAMRRE